MYLALVAAEYNQVSAEKDSVSSDTEMFLSHWHWWGTHPYTEV